MSARDIHGFYKRLGVSPNASQAEIKNAHRARAMALHPDRNRDKNATSAFQALQEAYAVLSNEGARSKYDAECAIPPPVKRRDTRQDRPVEPVLCSTCNAISAQPRYKVFHTVYAYVIDAHKDARQGVFCSKCEIRVGLKASFITLLAGWWSIKGFLWTVQTLFLNLVGGTFHEENARLYGVQARYFARRGDPALARAIAVAALKLANKADSGFKGARNPASLRTLKISLKLLINSIPAAAMPAELASTNEILNKRFVLQLMLLIAFFSLVYSSVRFA